jgi:hypothetical protein|nr:MAG TPA: Major capsid protein [Caudoviricetes sp.]
MPNTIELFKKNAPELLDKIYKAESTTSDFDINGALVQAGKNANEIIVPVLDMDGLGDYDRNSGYIDGDVSLTNETKKFNYERGRKLKTDTIDNEETGGVILGNLSAEFLRTKVIPEVDAVRYATYASIPGISKSEETTYSNAEAVYKAIAKAWDDMTNDEVPEENRHLRITSTLLGMIRDMDTYKSKDLLSKFASIKVVPQVRFQTAIELLSGKDSDGERKGGFKKAQAVYEASTDTTVTEGKVYYTKSGDTYTKVETPTGNPSTSNYYEKTVEESKDINFMIIHKPALLQYTKHNKMKLFTPDQDQDGDNYKWLYRLYGLNEYYNNKVAGIYLSHK